MAMVVFRNGREKKQGELAKDDPFMATTRCAHDVSHMANTNIHW